MVYNYIEFDIFCCLVAFVILIKTFYDTTNVTFSRVFQRMSYLLEDILT